MRTFAISWLLAVPVLGCSSAGRDGDGFGSGLTSGASTGEGTTSITSSGTGATDTSEGGENGSASESSAGETESEGEDAPKYDVGGGEGGPPGCNDPDGACGCSGVDLLFVIDDSGSMQPYQQALAQTFPLFVDAMIAGLPAGTDLHVGITSTSFGSPSAGGKGSSGCNNDALDAEAAQYHYPPPSQHNGQNGGQGRLFVHDGKTYFAMNTSDDPSGLKQWFTGAATAVGEQGSNWEMVTAGGAFVAHPDNATHNAGFLRDKGSVLVVFVLTDEHDNSPEDASVYHDMLSGAKTACGGDACIVAGGLMPTCIPKTPANVLWQFVNSFGEPPVLGDIGSENDTSHYPDVLGQALAQIIADTCEEIPPAG